jgi:ABC-type transport system substrate-binding protein
MGPTSGSPSSVAARNTPTYRDPAVILIDQLKEIWIDGELDPVETANWFPKLARKEYQIGLNNTGSGVDDPDQQFFETTAAARSTTIPAIATSSWRSCCSIPIKMIVVSRCARMLAPVLAAG